ncbi:MAG: ABC transporter ATP-binding protein [Bacteroidota bacterium]
MSLSIINLNKEYPNGVKALNQVNWNIGIGMFGLLGPNGAGKSSLMRTIATLQRPDSGELCFEGIDILKEARALRKVLGYLPQSFGVYPKVSGRKLLDYFATLKGIDSKKERQKVIDWALEMTNLTHAQNKHVHTYSGGMRQRFGIAQLLLNNPKLIIVDEPTAGLDPAERKHFLHVLREISLEKTIILSTHIVDDVAGLCTEVAVMNKGELLLKSPTHLAINALEGKIWSRTLSPEEWEGIRHDLSPLSYSYTMNNQIKFRIHASEQPDASYSLEDPTLDDVYFIALRSN